MEDAWSWWESIGSPRTVVAPMIERSDLAFRLMCRKYGADLAYTQMLHAQVLVRDPQYQQHFIDSSNDSPLIVQLAANDPGVFVRAGLIACRCKCVAVDLNLGCPQDMARRGRYGAFIQDEWSLIAEMIRTATRALPVPVTAKIRIFEDPKKSVDYARMLVSAGVKMLAVHGRTRQMRGPLTGMASWEQIALIRSAIPEVPVIANGNIRYLSDVADCLTQTGADAVMSAETILHNPTLFSEDHVHSPARIIDITREYLSFVENLQLKNNQFNTVSETPLGVVRGHLFKFLYPILNNQPQWREVFARCKSYLDLTKTVDKVDSLIQQGLIPEDSLYCRPRLRTEAASKISPGIDLKNVWLEDFSAFDDDLSFDCMLCDSSESGY